MRRSLWLVILSGIIVGLVAAAIASAQYLFPSTDPTSPGTAGRAQNADLLALQVEKQARRVFKERYAGTWITAATGEVKIGVAGLQNDDAASVSYTHLRQSPACG